jgi:uncharacterized protein DUF7033
VTVPVECFILITCPNEFVAETRWVLGMWASRYNVDAHFVDSTADIPEGTCVIMYGDRVEIPGQTVHIPHIPIDSVHLSPDNVCWIDHGGTPILDLTGAGHSVTTMCDDDVSFGIDIVVSIAAIVLSEQSIPMERDTHGRVPLVETLMGKLGLIGTPVVDQWLGVLSDAVSVATGIKVEQRNHWGGAPFAICITHDIDRVTRGWVDAVRRGRSLILAGEVGEGIRTMSAALRVLMTGHDLYWNLREVLELDVSYGVSPTFFLLPSRKHELDARFDINERRWRRIASEIRDAGGEIGLHAGYESFRNSDTIAGERRRLQEAVGGITSAVRQHYLRFDPRVTPGMQSCAGLHVDTSAGFAELPGFRHGTAFPHRWFDRETNRELPIVEIPLVLMDRTLDVYLDLTPEQAWDHIVSVLGRAADTGGCFSILWHNHILVEACFPGWKELYEQILTWARGRGARFITCTDASQSFLDTCEGD